MDLRGFTDLGKDIGRRVTDAINTGNFDQLNRDVKRTFEEAFNNDPGDLYRDALDGKLSKDENSKGFDRVYTKYDEAPPAEDSKIKTSWRSGVPAAKNMPGRGKALAMIIAGFSLAGIFGVTAIGMAFMTLAAVAVGDAAVALSGAVAGFTGLIGVVGLILGINGTKKYGVIKRFSEYKSLMKKNSFCLIKEMSGHVGKSENFVVKDLTKIIERGYFPEGHIDDHRKYFIGSDATYRQYLAAKESAEKAKQEAEEEARKQAAVSDEPVQGILQEGQAYIKNIQQANDAIYDPVISEKLFRMEVIVKKIFDHVEANPNQAGQLRRFMNYYMPTTDKLVKAYQQMDQETVLGRNMKKAKSEIAETLDTINDAYEKLYDSMHVDIAMDVSSDISVLKTMFAQEGLSDDKIGGKKDE